MNLVSQNMHLPYDSTIMHWLSWVMRTNNDDMNNDLHEHNKAIPKKKEVKPIEETSREIIRPTNIDTHYLCKS